tara:strand:- start:796 stop:1038 length:243 start_codon:yes stop_codon:yes gene_type:complete
MATAGFDLYQALKAYYESQRQESLAILKLCITSPAAIGEHTNLLQDMKEWTKKLAEAEESLAVLEKHFVIQDPTPPIIND